MKNELTSCCSQQGLHFFKSQLQFVFQIANAVLSWFLLSIDNRNLGKMISIFFFFGCWTLEPQACFFLFFFLENKSIYVYLHLIKLCFLVSMWSSDGWWRKALCSSRASISLSWEGMTEVNYSMPSPIIEDYILLLS